MVTCKQRNAKSNARPRFPRAACTHLQLILVARALPCLKRHRLNLFLLLFVVGALQARSDSGGEGRGAPGRVGWRQHLGWSILNACASQMHPSLGHIPRLPLTLGRLFEAAPDGGCHFERLAHRALLLLLLVIIQIFIIAARVLWILLKWLP